MLELWSTFDFVRNGGGGGAFRWSRTPGIQQLDHLRSGALYTRMAGELDEDGKPHIFTKGGDVFPKWRIVNSGNCGWTLEVYFEGEGWQAIGVTYKDYYKEDCKACTGPCLTDEALTTDEVYHVDDGAPLSEGVSLALGNYEGGTFTPLVQPPPPPPPQQLAVQVSCSATLCMAGIDGTYLAGELDEYGTHVFAKDEVTILDTTWRIRNTKCGWKIEESSEGPVPPWIPRATTTFTGDCEACTGSCQKEEALTTDETSEQGVSLVLGHYVGGTFVAA